MKHDARKECHVTHNVLDFVLCALDFIVKPQSEESASLLFSSAVKQ